MSEALATAVVAGPLAGVHAQLDRLRDLPLDLASDDEIAEPWRGLETISRRVSSIEHAVITQAAGRGLEVTAGARTMTNYARHLLRITAAEAKARIVAAEAAGS